MPEVTPQPEPTAYTSSAEPTPTKSLCRFSLGLPAAFLYFLLLCNLLRLLFIGANWPALRPSGAGALLLASLKGLRFDAATICYCLMPATFFYFLAGWTRWRALRGMLLGYLVALALLIPILWLADMQYFEEAGKHFTYEASAYLNLSVLPIIAGAWGLHPWISSISLLGAIAFAWATALGLRRLLAFSLGARPPRWWFMLPLLALFALGEVIGARGGLQGRTLKIGNSCISPSPYLNAVCLNPIFSVMKTTTTSSTQQFRFYSEASNIHTARQLLNCAGTAGNAEYPLLRDSAGTGQGNRKNVVIFVLESFSGKDMGCLGSTAGVTPFFDELSRQGLLFTDFYATGIRTAEGIFTILNSFPNQPLRPIMDCSAVYQTRWRALSEILGMAGYRSIFVHGRNLEFDQMREFLGMIHFNKIIDRNDFSAAYQKTTGSWPGYNDVDVMRRADEEFSAQKHPFLGVIYTMNTHPPFMTPPDFPRAYPDDTPSNRFLNSLKYSDYALKVFFDLVKTRPYFKDTIFVLVADHARTRDQFNLSDQHHIPLIIYAPGYVKPERNPVVGSQIDIMPTVLALLNLKATHASWGRNLLAVPRDQGFAVSVVGNDVRWHDSHYLVSDGMSERNPLMFDTTRDPTCTTDIWDKNKTLGKDIQARLRAYVSLSGTLLLKNRVYPGKAQPVVAKK